MKILKPLLLFICYLSVPILVHSQQRVAERINNARSSGINFTEQNIFSLSKANKANLVSGDVFRTLENVTLLTYNSRPETMEGSHLSIPLPMNGKTQYLDLIEVKEKFYAYNVVTDKGERYTPDRKRAKHYRGVIRGLEKSSLVAISFFEGDVKGVITTPEGNYNIGKLKDNLNIILYNERDLIQKNEFLCETIDDDFKLYDPKILDGTETRSDNFDTNCVRFYFETEFDLFQNLGSVAAVENLVTALYNQVAILYDNEGVDTRISEINVWTSADPYTSGSTSGTLTEFQNNINAFNGDLGHLLTSRSMGGRAAGFDGLCNTDIDERLCMSGSIGNVITNVPTYSWEVMVVAHEFGHLFGLRHTHACVWNGNNTAIDGCSGCQENPNPNINTCNNCPRPPSPATGGTVMSYCHIDPVGINFNNGFGQQPGNVMRANVANASCLTDCDECIASGANFDLYMKDQPSDTGVEPNPQHVTWTSQDIWIRQNLDGGTTHQNAEFKTLSPNGVYVRVRNLSSQTSACATLKVYWTKASAGLIWPTNFINYFQNVGGNPVLHGDIIGTIDIPAITGGGSTILELPWYPPNPADYTSDQHHFCLTARIVSADDPMANEVVGRIEPNARNNNNIIQKNISVQDLNATDTPVGVFFRGVDRRSEFINVLFRDRGFGEEEIDGTFFERGGLVEVTIEEEYFKRMLEYGSLDGEGIKILDENKVLIYSPEAVFKKVPLSYKETFLMQFNFTIEKIGERDEVIFDVIQQNAENRDAIGGERFLIKKSDKSQKASTEKIDLKIIPNPNNGWFQLDFTGSTKATYLIFDVYGNQVEEGNLKTGETQMNLSKLPNGIYFVKVISGDTELNKTFIKK